MTEPKVSPSAPQFPKTSVIPYLVTVVIVFLIATVGAITLETLRPEKDNSALIIQIFGIATVLIPLIFNLLKSQELAAKQEAIHIMVNSHMTALLEKSEAAAHAEGERIGRENADARTDALREAIPVNSVQMVTRLRTGTTAPLINPPIHPTDDKK